MEHGGNEVDFHAASQIPYYHIGIKTMNLFDLSRSDINHALRWMSDAGAQVSKTDGQCFTCRGRDRLGCLQRESAFRGCIFLTRLNNELRHRSA